MSVSCIKAEVQEFENNLIQWSAEYQQDNKPIVCDECRLHLKPGQHYFFVTDKLPMEQYCHKFFFNLPISPSEESGITIQPTGSEAISQTFEYFRCWIPNIYNLWSNFHHEMMSPVFICCHCSELLKQEDKEIESEKNGEEVDPTFKCIRILALSEVILRSLGVSGGDNSDVAAAAAAASAHTEGVAETKQLSRKNIGQVTDWDVMYDHLFKTDHKDPMVYSLDQDAIDKWFNHAPCLEFLKNTCQQVVDVGACSIFLAPSFLRRLISNPHEIYQILGSTKPAVAKKAKQNALALLKSHVLRLQKEYVEQQSKQFPEVPTKNFWKDKQCESIGQLSHPYCKLLFQSPRVNWEIQNWSNFIQYLDTNPETKDFLLSTGILKVTNPHLSLMKKYQVKFIELHSSKLLKQPVPQ